MTTSLPVVKVLYKELGPAYQQGCFYLPPTINDKIHLLAVNFFQQPPTPNEQPIFNTFAILCRKQ